VTDAELIMASRGDPRAFRELYDRCAVAPGAYPVYPTPGVIGIVVEIRRPG
jgi:hypothetical protein